MKYGMSVSAKVYLIPTLAQARRLRKESYL